MLYHNSESASRQTNLYLKSILAIKKGREKKADRALRDLSVRLSDPEQVMLRRVWWGRQTWERVLGDLEEAASAGQPASGELLNAYRNAWASTQEDWDRWHEHFRHLRGELGNWLTEGGRTPVPLDLGAEKPEKELQRAEAEFARQAVPDEAPEEVRLRSNLALKLDYTLGFDVEWGASFTSPASDAAMNWPWERRWPHDHEGMVEWTMFDPMGGLSVRSGEPLLGTVVRLMNGRGAIRTGQWLGGQEVSASGALIQTFQDTLVVVCDGSLLVLQWTRSMGGNKGTWATVDAFPLDRVRIGRERRVDLVEVIDPATGRRVFWLSLDHLRKPLVDALLDAKGQEGGRR